MNRDEAKKIVKDGLSQYLEQTERPLKKPFQCLNPGHTDNNPSMSYDKKRNKVHCFSCGADYDTFDLIGIDYNLTDKDKFKKGFELFGLTVDPYRTTAAEDFRPKSGQNQTGNSLNTQYTTHNTQHIQKNRGALDWDAEIGVQTPPSDYDFTSIAEAAHKELLNNSTALEYFFSRGLTIETIKAHKLGYSSGGYNALVKGFPELNSNSRKADFYNYVYPVYNNEGKCCYLLTEISNRDKIDQYNGKYRKMKSIPACFYNMQYLEKEAPGTVYICEGVFDALSIEQLGGNAIALTGTAHNSLINTIARNKPDTVYIIALDGDVMGSKAAKELSEKLQELGVTSLIRPPQGGKDANDILKENPQFLEEYIIQTQEEADQLRHEEERRQEQEYLQSSAYNQLQSFVKDIEDSKRAIFHPTGFPSLDEVLDGGLYAGLYCVGAISSLGKTTFCLQIADTLAAAGTDVIIFSLEMARNELIAKSVSRHTLLEDLAQYNSTKEAKTTRGILTGSRYEKYSKTERGIIAAAIKSYQKYAEHIFINVGIGNIGIEEIRQTIEQHIKITHNTPAIIIDYLQIIAPSDVRSTDKQNTDKAVLELKRISRDFSTPVIGISSFNRDNYHAPVNLASFKESGAIEYSSDVLIGLQYAGMDYKEGESEKARETRVRALLQANIEKAKIGLPQQIQVKVLKNRNGSKGGCFLDFYPMFNYFTESNIQDTLQSSTSSNNNSSGSAGGDQPQIGKREQQRQELVKAFFDAEDTENKGQTTLEAMADILDIRKTTLKSRLKEYSAQFTIEGDIVKYTNAEKERTLYADSES